jgi:DNA-binding XRE family transcriptional regulator
MAKKSARDHRYDVGVLIGLRREELGQSQTEAGATVGVSQTKWNHWEKHLAFPRPDQLEAILYSYFNDGTDIDTLWVRAAFQRATEDWKRLGPPVPTRSYDTPKGKKGEPHTRRGSV